MEEEHDPSEEGIVNNTTGIEMYDEMDDEEGEAINLAELTPEELQQLLIERPDLAEQLINQGIISVGDDEGESEGEAEYDDDGEGEEEYMHGEEDMSEEMGEKEREMGEDEDSEVS
jgi:hypothetical protein